MSTKTKSFRIKLCGILSAVLLLTSGVALISSANDASPKNADENTSVYKKSDVFEYDDNIEKVVDARPFETQDGDKINAEPNGDTSVGKTTNGVGIYASTSGATFTYKNEIDFSDLTTDDNLIEIFPLYAEQWASLNTLRVTFTDTENSNNTFSVYYYTFTNGALYARVEYAGKSLALGNESANFGQLISQYGTWCSGNYLTLTPAKTYPTPLSVCVDYAERQVYIKHATKLSLVLDLDDVTQVGKGSIWQGFEKDTAYMSVSIGLAQPKQGGVIVKSVLGHNLDGSFYGGDNGDVLDESLFDAPTVQFDMPSEYLAEMPDAEIGVGYPLPKAIARDWYFGTCGDDDISVKVYRKNSDGQYADDVTSLVDGGRFIATQTGDYQLVYTASNPVKSQVEKLSFKVVDKLPPITVQMQEAFVAPEILTQLSIPRVSAYGGSGNLQIVETLFYNGVEQSINEARTLYVDKPGTVLLKIVCMDYCESETVEYFPLVIPDTVVLSVQNVPKVLQSSTTIILPEAICYDTLTNQPKTATIKVDGVALGADRSYEVEKTSGSVDVEYTADGAISKTFTIPVIDGTTMRPADLMLKKSGEITAEDSSNGVYLTANKSGSEIYWAYPVVTGYSSNNAFITISNAGLDKANFDYVDITFANCASETETAFVRIYRDCDADAKMSYVQVNGVGAKYLVDGNLSVTDSSIYLCVDTANGYLKNGINFSPICEIGGYSAQTSIVGFRFGNVAAGESASILVYQISNQYMQSGEDWSDINKPVVSFDRELKKEFEAKRGSVVQLPTAKAYDMLSENATVKVRVYDPDNNQVEISDGTFVASKAGKYRISYISEDINGKKGNANYYCTVYDDKEPVMTIEYAVSDSVKVGDTITIPNATAIDEVDGECTVYAYMRCEADYSFEAVTLGGKYKFTRKGVYHLTYLTRDSDFNYVEYVMTVTVR